MEELASSAESVDAVRTADAEPAYSADSAMLFRHDDTKRPDDYLNAEENERIRLTRELHDLTGPLLLTLSLSVAHLREAGRGDTDEILDEIGDTIREIDSQIRTFSYIEYPAELGASGLVAAIETFARGFARRTGLRIDFQNHCTRSVADRSVATALLRTVQEALANVHRHAQASSVHMSLVERLDRLELSVSDDGCGLPRSLGDADRKGVGVQGMRHRIERLGGRFILKRLKHGTKLLAQIPIAPLYSTRAHRVLAAPAQLA